ncbi:MAG: hypothetical protein JXN64_09030 [Spirochaetes bacterium]|nr:hypothetical protein [Spirochaetota bacterium]
MTIKPIDVQTNIAHLHEIAKGEHGRSAAYIHGEHILEKNAEEEARRIRNKLEENKHAEKTLIMREERQKQKKDKGHQHEDADNNDNSEEKANLLKQTNIGLRIDVKR